MFTTNATKITSKGQVTLPKKVRELLSTDFVTFQIDGDDIKIKPVRSVRGSLSHYNIKITNWEKAREKAWEHIIDEYER